MRHNLVAATVDDGRYPSAFASYCFWGPQLVNARHELGASLLRVILLLEELRCTKSITPEVEDRLLHWFGGFFGSGTGYIKSNGVVFQVLNDALDRLAATVRSYDAILAEKLEAYETSLGDFLPGSFYRDEKGRLFHLHYSGPHETGALQPIEILRQPEVQQWGQLLTKESPWPSWDDLFAANHGGNGNYRHNE